MREIICLFGLSILISNGFAFGQAQELPRIYRCVKTEQPLTIDGRAGEAAWKKARWTKDFVDIESRLKPAPEFRTRIKMLWDENGLYIFAELEEPHIWAKLSERDQIIYHDNDFEVFIDPDGDYHNYFELEINALGTAFDLFMNRPYNAGGRALIGWDIADLQTGIFADGTINQPDDIDTAWCVEIAIPWKSLQEFAPRRQPPQTEDIWRMNFSRVQWETKIVKGKYKKLMNPDSGKPLPESNWVWSPQGAINMHLPEKWGYVVFANLPADTILTIADVDPYFKIKQQLLNLYQQQKDFYKHRQRYASSLYELNKQGRSSENTVLIQATSWQFLISITSEDGKRLFIDHEKRIWME